MVPQEVINLPDFVVSGDVDLSCLSVPNLPNGGRFSSPGWDGKFLSVIRAHSDGTGLYRSTSRLFLRKTEALIFDPLLG